MGETHHLQSPKHHERHKPARNCDILSCFIRKYSIRETKGEIDHSHSTRKAKWIKVKSRTDVGADQHESSIIF